MPSSGRPDSARTAGAAGAPAATELAMLFADLEASTALALKLGAGWPDVLRAYRRILREAIADAGGRIESTEGDSFFATFPEAADAVTAAAAAQRSLRVATWPEYAGELRVRMGVHVGEALDTDGHLVGVEVHRGARVAAAAHGGQVLVTAPVRAGAGREWRWEELGEHRLKDFEDPTALWHLVVHDDRRAGSFPPPRAADPFLRTADPVLAAPPATPTVGRNRELDELLALLVGRRARLVTLLGSGGVGKSRLALEVGHAAAGRFADGARFIPLAPVAGAEVVGPTIAHALGVRLVEGESPAQALARMLARRELLLILDNFEHVLEAASIVDSLLASCPRLAILVTSRSALDLGAEQRFTVAPLPVGTPELPLDDHEPPDAVQLFLQRVRRHEAGFSASGDDLGAIQEICQRLDGLPLAIELAAPAVPLFGVRGVAERLRENVAGLNFAARGSPERHRSLHATLDWSHELLEPAEQQAFARLGVFARGGTAATLESVTGASPAVLRALVDKSLLVIEPVGGMRRIGMLETVRQYAREHLEAVGDADSFRRRHFEFFLAFAEARARRIRTGGSAEAATEIDEDIDELRAALTWSLAAGPPDGALRLASALAPYWLMRDAREGDPWLEAALERGTPHADPDVLAEALVHRAYQLRRRGLHPAAEAAARRSLELYEQAADAAGAARSMIALSWVLFVDRKRRAEAAALARQAVDLARPLDDPTTLAEALAREASVEPDLARALAAGGEAAELFRAAGNHQRLCWLQSDLAYASLACGEDAAAMRLAHEGLEAGRAGGGWTDSAFVIGNASLAALFLDDLDQAADGFRRELEVASEWGLDDLLFEALNGLAAVFAASRQDDVAARLEGAADGATPERHEPRVARRLDERFFDPARRRYTGWRRAYEAGFALDREQAVGLGLSRSR